MQAGAMHDVAAASAPSTSNTAGGRWRAIARTAFPFIVVGAMWEITAHLGVSRRRSCG